MRNRADSGDLPILDSTDFSGRALEETPIPELPCPVDKSHPETPFELILNDYYIKKEIKKLNLEAILREPSVCIQKKSLSIARQQKRES